MVRFGRVASHTSPARLSGDAQGRMLPEATPESPSERVCLLFVPMLDETLNPLAQLRT